jgi:hypothetical protein
MSTASPVEITGGGYAIQERLAEGSAAAGDCSKCKGLGLVPVTHVFDIIGGENYPNVADWLEETRRLGVSRRLELGSTEEYARLSPRSRLFLLHRRAVIDNPADYYAAMSQTELGRLARADCPKYHPQHTVGVMRETEGAEPFYLYPDSPAPGCAALYWHDLQEGAESIPEHFRSIAEEEGGAPAQPDSGRFAERRLVSGTYRGYRRPEGVKPVYALGAFAVFPVARLQVINASGEHTGRVERASAAGVEVEEADY